MWARHGLFHVAGDALVRIRLLLQHMQGAFKGF